MKKQIVKIFILIFYLCSFTFCMGQGPEGFNVVKDLKSEWLFYNSKEANYLPYIPENGQQTNAIHFFLNIDRYPGESLIVNYPDNTSLWIDDKLIQNYAKSELVITRIDSLREIIPGEELHIILYNPNKNFNQLRTIVGHEATTWNSYDQLNKITKRKDFAEKDSFLIITLIIISLFTLLFQLFPKDFRDFFNIGSLFLVSTASDDFFKPKTQLKAQMIFLLALSSLIAFLLVVYHYYQPLQPLTSLLGDAGVIGSWMIITFLTYLVIISKYLLIYLASALFNIGDKINYYFFEIVILSMVFYTLLFILLAGIELLSFSSTESFIKIMVYPIVVFYILRLIILFFKIRSGTSIKNLHLFSYLCSTELLPIVIGLKYFFK